MQAIVNLAIVMAPVWNVVVLIVKKSIMNANVNIVKNVKAVI